MNAIGRAKLCKTPEMILAARLLGYHVQDATESAGSPRRKRGNGDVWLVCAVLLIFAIARVALL